MGGYLELEYNIKMEKENFLPKRVSRCQKWQRYFNAVALSFVAVVGFSYVTHDFYGSLEYGDLILECLKVGKRFSLLLLFLGWISGVFSLILRVDDWYFDMFIIYEFVVVMAYLAVHIIIPLSLWFCSLIPWFSDTVFESGPWKLIWE